MSTKSVAAKGRPKSASKKTQILQAASKLFVANGFDGVSMDAIAAEAGVSKQTIYSHFGGKEELFSHVVAERCVSYELSEEFLDGDRPFADMLQEVGERFLHLLLSEEALAVHRLIIVAGDRHPRLADLYYREGPQRMCDLVTGYLRAQSLRGQFPVTDFRRAATDWLSMLKGEAHMRSILKVPLEQTDAQLSEHVAHCVTTLLRAYSAE